jgi:hypothetical protein
LWCPQLLIPKLQARLSQRSFLIGAGLCISLATQK